MKPDIALKYEALLKKIYNIPRNSTTLHFTHGAHADVIRHVMNSSVSKEERESATYEDIFNHGFNLGEASTYLREALDYAIHHTDVNPIIKEELSSLYSSHQITDVSTLLTAIERAFDILQVDF